MEYPRYTYRVEIDYLSRNYPDRMLSSSSPYEDRNAAQEAYNAASRETCLDDPARPARVSLDRYTWPAPGAYGIPETIARNY